MQKGVLAFALMFIMVSIGFVAVVANTEADPREENEEDVLSVEMPTRFKEPWQKTDPYETWEHPWDDSDWESPIQQRWHNWSNFLPHYEQREYWLRCKNITDDYQWLDIVNDTTNGDEVGLYKEDVNLTQTLSDPMNFTYPRADKDMYALYDESMGDIGILNFTINPMGLNPNVNPSANPLMGRYKEVNVEVWVDRDGDYNWELGEGTIEGLMRFDFDWWKDPYDPLDPGNTLDPHITNASEMHKTFRQMEEYVDGIGYWMDINEDGYPDIPGDIVGGRIWVCIYRTDNNPDDFGLIANRTADLLVYCGYNEKLSWIVLPFIHPKQLPVAKTGDDIGFPSNKEEWMLDPEDPYWEPPEFDEEYFPQLKEGELVYFDATKSYDPQDDIGADDIGYGEPGWVMADDGEGNENIDDGIPEGEEDLGETDNLHYKWEGKTYDGKNILMAGGWQKSPTFDFKFRLPTMDQTLPAEDQWMIINVTLTVRDKDNNQGKHTIQALVYKSQHAPVVDIHVIPQVPKKADHETYVLDGREVIFNGYANDPDPNSELSYHWLLTGPEGIDTKDGASIFLYTFAYTGEYDLQLTVYDGPIDDINTMSGNATFLIHVIENSDPVPVVRASHTPPENWKFDHIDTTKGQTVFFNGSHSYDPDVKVYTNEEETEFVWVGLPGWDQDEDGVSDYPFKYKWDWGDNEYTPWSYVAEAEHSWNEKGSKSTGREFWPIKLYVWDGREESVNESYQVFVNLEPKASAGKNRPDPNTDPEELEVGMAITFDGIGSYDPNDDPTYDGIYKKDKKRDPNYADQLAYIWDFGDGSPQVEGRRVTHTYSKDNVYTVRLVVGDGHYTDETTITVKIVPANQPPKGIIKITAESWIDPDKLMLYTLVPITYDASESYDPDGDAYNDDMISTQPIDDLVSITWSLGDGTITHNPKYNHIYPQNGIYHVTINMTDRKGAIWELSYNITVVNRPPVVEVDITVITICIDEQPVLLSSKGSYDDDGSDDELRFYWTFGDGTHSDETKGEGGYQRGIIVPHIYDKVGTYTAKVWARDDDNGTTPEDGFAKVTVKIIKEDTDPGGEFPDVVLIGGVAAFISLLTILSTMFVWIRKRL